LPNLIQWMADGLIDTISGDDVPFLASLVERARKEG
jgi:glycerophosphoryl diester phosphodiesterase